MNKTERLLDELKEYSEVFASLAERLARELASVETLKNQLLSIISEYSDSVDVSTSIAESQKTEKKVKKTVKVEVKKEEKVEKLSVENIKSRINDDCKIMFNNFEIANLKKLKTIENRLEKGIAFSLNSILKYESTGKLIPVQLSTYLKLIKSCIENKTDLMD